MTIASTPPGAADRHDTPLLDRDDETGPWEPYVHEPLITPQMILGPERTPVVDFERLQRYLAALVEARATPVHVNVAFNAAYFGFDLVAGGYVGGQVELFGFPGIDVGSTTETLPVGAMVNIVAGADPLFAEVVYKEGAHRELGPGGALPDWLSGAPAGAVGPGEIDELSPPVLRERLVVDFNAFGSGLSRTREQFARLRRQQRVLNHQGHLVVEAQYESRAQADLDERALYVQYLLTRGRSQLMSAALPMQFGNLLGDGAGSEEHQAALFGIMRTIRAALVSLSDPSREPLLHMWGDYAFSRRAYSARFDDRGPLGGEDMHALLAQLHRSPLPSRRGRWASGRTVSYTAVGRLLEEIEDAGDRLNELKYPAAVCHFNTVVTQYVARDGDEATGLLRDGVHLRLDDRWQGGGVWRAEHPGSDFARIDPDDALGLGWRGSVQVLGPAEGLDVSAEEEPAPEAPNVPESFDDFGSDLVVTDSQSSWEFALRAKHLEQGWLPVPERVAVRMRSAGVDTGVRVRLVLDHDGRDLDATHERQHVQVELFATPRLCEVTWPVWEFFPGLLLSCRWAHGSSKVQVNTTLLEKPVEVEGFTIDHRYDPRALTRDIIPVESKPFRAAAAPGEARLIGPEQWSEEARRSGRLTLAQRVVFAIRTLGLLDERGCAVVARTTLPTLVHGGCEAGREVPWELADVVDDLVASGRLRVADGSVDAAGNLAYPPVPGDQVIPVVRYEPTVREGQPRRSKPSTRAGLDQKWVRRSPITPHLRDLRKSGRRASEKARQAYREDWAAGGYDGPAELPEHFTYARPKKH
ncbi:hypothetical protein [Amycolatopsis sp. NPDC098790]|uniref:hypothetical protein n=1 Tax=Amycolatopsis sp. NPDC098790 TaxID=3363939 RepID=UPI003811EDC3